MEELHYLENDIEVNKKLYDIFKGQLGTYTEQKINEENNSAITKKELNNRLSPINIIPRVVDKLSNVYSKTPTRNMSEANQELLDYFQSVTDIDVVMQRASEFITLQGACLIEPYLDSEGLPSLRVIPHHQFMVWSDDKVDPTNPTVVVKFMGIERNDQKRVDQQGDTNSLANQYTEDIQLFHAYSDTEFVIFDSTGVFREDLMTEMGFEDTLHGYGTLPMKYLNRDPDMLRPYPDADTLRMSILVPRLLTDLNYATKYMSHTLLYAVGVDPQSILETGPDSIMFLTPDESNASTGIQPELNALKPTVDSDKAIELIKVQVGMWLDSKGLKPGVVGSVGAESAMSGIAKMIEEAEVINKNDKMKALFRNCERKIFETLAMLQNNTWSAETRTINRAQFIEPLQFAVTYPTAKTVEEPEKVINQEKQKLEAGLTSKRRAIKAVHPGITDEEVDNILAEIEAEQAGIFNNVLGENENA